jgi:membrane fusion protein (multidrug efflux system)
VPVRLEVARRQAISEHLETNGTLEAENEVDLVARAAGPITELLAEEGDTVAAGELLARIDDREAQNQVAIATVNRDEARLAFNRAQSTFDKGLVSQEAHDVALSALQSAAAQLEAAELQLAYTEVRAPFAGLVVTRHIRQAQYVSPGTPLFRLSDFTPLLCPIEVPEKDLSRLRVAQPARLQVEAFPEETFDARVLRIRPTVDPTTGTVTVTLEVEGRDLLRPGMFASVFLETDTHEGALVVPREALVLDSIGDTVFVRDGDVAVRREVRLGFRDQELVEVLEGVAEGDEVIVLGQDGLADGTPVVVLDGIGSGSAPAERGAAAADGPPADRLEMIRQRLRERGLSDEEIEQRLEQIRQRGGPGRGPGPGGGIPPFMADRIRSASPEELEQIRERMRGFGMDDERIDEVIRQVRKGGEQ